MRRKAAGIDTRALSQQSMAVQAVPGLHFIGDSFGATSEGKPAIAAKRHGQLPHGQVFPPRAFQNALAPALALIGLWDLGQGRVQIKATRIHAKRDGKRADAAIGMHKVVQ